MPLGPGTIRAEKGAVGDALKAQLGLTDAVAGSRADVEVCTQAPRDAGHVIVAADLTDAIDVWDADVAPQTVAGALWLPPSQRRAADAAVAWLVLRLQTPTTPLSDLTDNNGRALRWSIADAVRVDFPRPADASVDPDEVTRWADAQPAVVDLGQAVERIGGHSAEAVLASVTRLREALRALVPLGAAGDPVTGLDEAVAEHLRQVQRTGFARWRAAKARAASQAALQSVAREVAARRLGEVLHSREREAVARAVADIDDQAAARVRELVRDAVADLTLPVEPDFDKAPRSWTSSVPAARRHVFVHEDHVDLFADSEIPVRAANIATHQAVCALVQSGFSLPALR